jgi:hypothetical protein
VAFRVNCLPSSEIPMPGSLRRTLPSASGDGVTALPPEPREASPWMAMGSWGCFIGSRMSGPLGFVGSFQSFA